MLHLSLFSVPELCADESKSWVNKPEEYIWVYLINF